MPEQFTFHHLGVAVSDLEQASAFYSQTFNFQLVSGPYDDPIQKVRACFLGLNSHSAVTIELICPLDNTSPVNSYLAKSIGAYHICYEVEEIGAALDKLWRSGCVVITQPVPAVAFAGRKIAWCFTPTRHLVELVERQPPVESYLKGN
jgi:methylmalonyl-CoA/ethylmalonyl-CoA epimerase